MCCSGHHRGKPKIDPTTAIADIAEIKQAQISQERAADEAKDRKEQQERFIDMISHEIRNPVRAIHVSAFILLTCLSFLRYFILPKR